MSLKMKLISTISAFMLVLGLMLFGVFAATNGTILMGGNLSFTATNVYAKVTGQITGAGVGNKTFEEITFSSSNKNPDTSDWRNLDLDFDSEGSPITIEITVENLAKDRTLSVNVQDNFASDSGVLVKEIVNDKSEGEYTGSNVVLSASTGEETSITTFTITFSLSSKDNSLTDVNFGYIINLYDVSHEFPAEEITDFTFSTTSDNTGAITSYTGTETEVGIPTSFSVITEKLETPGYTETFQDINEYETYIADENRQAILTLGFYYVTTPTDVDKYIGPADIGTFISTITEDSFPMTIKFTDFEINWQDLITYELDPGIILVRLLLESMGKVENITIKLSGGEEYIVNAGNFYDIMNELLLDISVQSSYPVNVIYPTEKVTYIEGNDYLVTSIGLGAFMNQINLTSVIIPEGVTTISTGAFYGCSNLQNISLPSSLLSVEENAFSDCSRLNYKTENNANYLGNKNNPYLYLASVSTIVTEYTINDRCKIIGDSVFSNNGTLINITFPSSLTSIGANAFHNCDGLTGELVIPEGIISIGTDAFSSCNGLTSISLPSTLKNIGNDAFYDCGNMYTIEYRGTLEEYLSVNFSQDWAYRQYDLKIDGKLITDLVIPSSITNIGIYTFSRCSSITSVSYEENSQLRSIDFGAFSDCGSLTSVTLPNTLRNISFGAFSSCSILTSIAIPEGVTSIEEVVFSGCSGLTSIIIPSSVTSIGASAFSDCDSIERLEFIGTLEEYLSIEFGPSWIDDNSHKLIINGVELTELVIPNSITNIGERAFYGCSGLTSVVIPEGVTSISAYAFRNCSLATIYIDSSTIANGITSSSSYGYLTQNATTLYIKDTITVTTAPNGWIVDSAGSEQVDGYVKYIKA